MDKLTRRGREYDLQRSRVYAAERCLRNRSKNLYELSEVQAYVRKVQRSRWWKKHDLEKSPIAIGDGRARRRACAIWELWEIRMPRFARHELCVLHEIAHLINADGMRQIDRDRKAGHDPDFVGWYIALVEQFMGVEMAEVLREKFRQHRVEWRNP